MKKGFKFIAILCTVIIAILSLCACSGTPAGINNIEVIEQYGPILDRGSHTVVIVAPQNVENPTKFKSDISKSDITLGKYLEGKTVDAVEYVDETTVKVTISGNANGTTKEWEDGVISVDKRACTNGEIAYTFVKVYNADLYAEMNLQTEDVLTPVFDRGTQTLTVVASPSAEKPTKFKSDISVFDIVLGEILEAKTVTKVEYVNDATIKVTMTGDTADYEEEWELGTLTVKARACTLGKDSYAYVKVYNTYISVALGDSKAGEEGNAYSEYSTIFTLNNGTFSSQFSATEDITLVPYAYFDDPEPLVNGKFTARMVDGNKLVIRINFVDTTISRYPKVRIEAGLIEGSEAFEIEIGLDGYDIIIL